ncbi:hypothetical protein [Natronorubrum sp. DTA28]|uniref:hypothetical protein n=1 Tax=Natronorubrum sp. DTA28 TaxID=3447019 RepID=UPI003F85D0A1
MGDDELAVTTDSRLTLHVGDATESVTAACEDLRELDRVLGVDRFETVDGPCRMKRW